MTLSLIFILTGFIYAIDRSEELFIEDGEQSVKLVIPPKAPKFLHGDLFKPGKPSGELKVWIFFTDKGVFSRENYIDRKTETWYNLSERNRIRRRRLGYDMVNFADLPLEKNYLSEITELGANLEHTSKWLNAATFRIPPELVDVIAELPFVREIRTVKLHGQKLDKITDKPIRFYKGMQDSNIYGGSYYQLYKLGVTEMQQAPNNLHGEGVMIGIFDTGFMTDHLAFDSINVIYTWDYIQGDSTVDNQEGDNPGQHGHGTGTLGTLAGFLEGVLVGPAYKADFGLFKTEQVDAETVWQEEDRWVRALEKAESLGVDIISSSLGYGTSEGEDGYIYEDLDGNTALTTIAADIAAARNVLVVTAAGNERRTPWHYIIAPGDGDSVLTCGAIDSVGIYASFSSPGPAADGRIKPDLAAQGVNVMSASVFAPDAVIRSGGTSYATPLLAGTAALVLQHSFSSDTLTAMELLDTLKATADQWYEPDNDYGWGRPHCLPATGSSGAAYGIVKDLNTNLPLPEVLIHYSSGDTIGEYQTDDRGRFLIPIVHSGEYIFSFSILGYMPCSRTVFINSNEKKLFEIDMNIPVDEKIFIFPNPFSDSLVVGVYPDSVDTIPRDELSIWLWNSAGQLVFETTVDIQYQNPFIWQPQTRSGKDLGSGIYIIVAEYYKYRRKEKIALIK